MRVFAGIALTGAASIGLHPLRSAVTTLCLLCALVPYLAAVGISKGLEREARVSLVAGADLYVSGLEFGRDVSLPQSAAGLIQRVPGVLEVIPRIVGPVTLGTNHESAVVVGLPLANLPKEVQCVEGRLFRQSNVPELVVGSELARRLNMKAGDMIPPFYHSSRGEHVSKIVGVFRSDASLWQARMIFTSLETAQLIFDEPAQVTGFLVNCRPGYEDDVRRQIQAVFNENRGTWAAPVAPRIVSRAEMTSYVTRSILHREGVFNLHFVLIFISAMLVILVTSGMGLAERRREIGILKAVGWQTDEVLVRHLFESFLLGLLGAGLSVLLAYAWLRVFNGVGIANIFLSGAGWRPEITVPFHLTVIPVLLAVVLSFVLVMTGTLFATWRAAVVPPREAMR